MQLYNCELRIGGDVGNTVPLRAVNASEVVMMRKVHGDDAVMNIHFDREDNSSTDYEFYQKLEQRFKTNPANLAMIRSMFGEPENPRLVKSIPLGQLRKMEEAAMDSAMSEEAEIQMIRDEITANGGKFNSTDGVDKLKKILAKIKLED